MRQRAPVPSLGSIVPPRVLVSRGQAFITSGVTENLKKIGPDGTVWNWGALTEPATPGSAGPSLPTVATISGVLDEHWSTVNWSNKDNALLTDAAYASVAITSPIYVDRYVWEDEILHIIHVPLYQVYSKQLILTGFGFAIPANAQITAIDVEVKGYVSGAIATVPVQLYKAGGRVGPVISVTTMTGTNAMHDVPHNTPLWDVTWTPAEINASNFGVAIQAYLANTGTGTLYVDSARITISYITGPMGLSAKTSGSVTLLSGRKYFVIPYSTITGVYTDVGIPSTSTGVMTNQQQPLTSILVPSDPQLDRKKLAATADGGNEAVLYELADLAASTTTYTDNTPEADLLVNNVLQETDDMGIEHGAALNYPPPPAPLFYKHRGRVYGLLGSTLYASKSMDDLTTSTGLICGRYEEAWPGDFQLDICEGAETGSALFSDGVYLYVGTERHIRKIVGDGPTNWQTPEVVFNEVGILSQEVLQVVFVEGQPVGVMWLTPDFKVMGSDFNTYANAGWKIQDVLNSINRAQKAKCHTAFYGSGAYYFYALAIPTGNNTECDTICVFDLRNKKWHIWTFPFTVSSMLFNIQADGGPRLILGTTLGKLYTLDPTEPVLDCRGEMTTPVPVTLKTPWMHFGDPTMRKDFNEWEVMSSDPALTFSLEGASNSDEFATPVSIVTDRVPVTSPFGDRKLYLAGARTTDRFYRATIKSLTGTTRRFLDGYSAEIIPEHKL